MTGLFVIVKNYRTDAFTIILYNNPTLRIYVGSSVMIAGENSYKQGLIAAHGIYTVSVMRTTDSTTSIKYHYKSSHLKYKTQSEVVKGVMSYVSNI